MKTRSLQQRGITFIEGQRNGYDPEYDTHRRSFICVTMKEELFRKKIEPYLNAFGVRYLTQSPTLWDLQQFGGCNGELWVTKSRGKCDVRIELLEDVIDIATDDIYVVMWRRRFLPKLFRSARLFDLDIILITILNGRIRPPWMLWLLI